MKKNKTKYSSWQEISRRNLPPDSLALSRTLDSEFAVTALFYYYGILAGCVVLLLIAWLLIRSCTACMKQKNCFSAFTGIRMCCRLRRK